MLERFAEEDRLEQMNMQAGAAEHDCLCSSGRCIGAVAGFVSWGTVHLRLVWGWGWSWG